MAAPRIIVSTDIFSLVGKMFYSKNSNLSIAYFIQKSKPSAARAIKKPPLNGTVERGRGMKCVRSRGKNRKRFIRTNDVIGERTSNTTRHATVIQQDRND